MASPGTRRLLPDRHQGRAQTPAETRLVLRAHWQVEACRSQDPGAGRGSHTRPYGCVPQHGWRFRLALVPMPRKGPGANGSDGWPRSCTRKRWCSFLSSSVRRDRTTMWRQGGDVAVAPPCERMAVTRTKDQSAGRQSNDEQGQDINAEGTSCVIASPGLHSSAASVQRLCVSA